ncbi:iron-containing alcohol dehydrogenase [Ihubacter sp. mB4P-1]|uniref:iron-containing alcohol dehydrogenase n=1 Tax=Ihubacter sp. mB4P-1 TaxID=3242370 RepID=UPI00137A47F9
MQNFDYSIPTKIYFGKGQIEKLSNIAQFGKRVLLVYGGGSIKKNGIFDRVTEILGENGIEYFELSGVEPNPRVETVERGADICRKNNIDAVLAVGGGSAIDCAKVVAAAAKYDGPAWDLVLDGTKIKEALPITAVLTIAATGSEMEGYAVITNFETNEKLDAASELLNPAFSILDPTYTYSVSRRQTASGTADIMSHVLEVYFTKEKDAFLQARLCEAVLKTCIQYGPIALEEPENYEARANLMWAGSLAINGLLSYGSDVPWSVHPLQHILAAYYDITHGEGLAILTPIWMEKVLSDETMEKFAEYGRNVWGISPHKETEEIARLSIEKTRAFFDAMGLPKTLREVGIGEEKLAEMAQRVEKDLTDTYVPLTAADVLEIYKKAL